MLVENTFDRIDPRLPDYMQDNKGYLFEEGKSLFCVLRLLWNPVDAGTGLHMTAMEGEREDQREQ